MANHWKSIVGFGLTYIVLVVLCSQDFTLPTMIKTVIHGYTLAWSWGWCMNRWVWSKRGKNGGARGPQLGS